MQTTKSVKDPSKQRLRLYNAPAHIRHKLMSAHLAPELVKSQGVKSLPVRKGDTVRIVRGDHEGFEGKISTVDLKNYRIFIEGLTREKVDGTVIFVSVHPSKVLVKNLNLDDRWRKSSIQRKKPLPGREEAEEKPAKKTAKPTEVKPKELTKTKEPVGAKEEVPLKPAAKKAKPAETKAVIPPTVEAEKKPEIVEEKQVEKKPRAAKKAIEKPAPVEAKEKSTAATKPAKTPSRKKEVKETRMEEKPVKAQETEKPTKKAAKTRSKKAAVKKTPAKSASKTKEKAGGA